VRTPETGGSQRWEWRLEHERGGDDVDGGVIDLGPHVFSLRTLDADARPVGARISVTAGGDPKLRVDTWSPDEDGEVTIHGVSESAYAVSVAFPDGSSAHAEFVVPRSDALVVQAPPTGRLAVHVVDAAGKAVSGATVLAVPWLGEGAPPDDPDAWGDRLTTVQVRTGAEGDALLLGVRAGHVRVKAYVPQAWGVAEPEPGRGPVEVRLELNREERRELELRLR
jgi:hypothetical protein